MVVIVSAMLGEHDADFMKTRRLAKLVCDALFEQSERDKLSRSRIAEWASRNLSTTDWAEAQVSFCTLEVSGDYLRVFTCGRIGVVAVSNTKLRPIAYPLTLSTRARELGLPDVPAPLTHVGVSFLSRQVEEADINTAVLGATEYDVALAVVDPRLFDGLVVERHIYSTTQTSLSKLVDRVSKSLTKPDNSYAAIGAIGAIGVIG